MHTAAPLNCRFSLCVLLAALGIAVTPYLHADASSATLSVEVADASGAVIPKARVDLRNTATNQKQETTTGQLGEATFTFLNPGQYAVMIRKNGFEDVTVSGIVLNVGDDRRLELVLKVGAATQSITVDGSEPTINTTNGSVSTVIDRKFVENIPLNGQSFQDLISLTPGVVTQSPQSSVGIGYDGDFSVNGQRTESNYYTVDGVSANIGAGNGYAAGQAATGGALAGSTALGTTQSLISVDALQEFRVQSSSYSAEYGRTPGGQFSFITRSGSNTVHGTVFDYLRNSYFDANDWFNNHYGISRPALRQNDFGGTVGGPVSIPRLYDGQNKTFFFVSYEGLRLDQPQAATLQYVPALSLRQSAPSALQAILNAYPLPSGAEISIACNDASYPCPSGDPTGTPVPSGLSPFTAAYSLPSRIDSTSIRIDQTFSPKLSLFFRYGYTPSASSTRSLSALTETTFDSRTYTIGAISQLSKRTSNDFRFGLAQSSSSVNGTLDSFGGAAPIDLAKAVGAVGYPDPYPVFWIFITGVGSSELIIPNSSNVSHQWNAVDTLALSLGRHQLKFGVDYRKISSPLNPASPLVEGVYESRQAVLANQATFIGLSNSITADPIFTEVAAFAQDEWPIATRVNISLGLRWELNPPPTEAHGEDAYTLLGNVDSPDSLTLAPRGSALWKTPYWNFAPRLGVAWSAHTSPGWETVVRAGGGVFFDTANQIAASGYSGIGFSANQDLYGAALPVTPAQLNFSPVVSPPYTNAQVYAFPTHLQLPYTLQWNVSVEQALNKKQTVTLSYLGSNGRRLLGEQQLYVAAINPNFGYVFYFPNGDTSNYQALQTQFQRSVSHGVQILASYTWSHSIDFGSTYAALPLERGNSDFDVRESFSGGLSWDLPTASKGEILSAVLSGWGMDGRLIARTGFPITINGNLLSDPGTGSQYYSGVDLVPGRPLYVYGKQYPGNRALNGGPGTTADSAAFVLPSGSNAGNAPRNLARGFGETQVNLAARRELPLRDHLVIQFRAEAFNLLNHPVFGAIDPTITDATFGQATDTLNQSLNTVASQYQQGGPRSMQFALKLRF